jgi:hypothetical protein
VLYSTDDEDFVFSVASHGEDNMAERDLGWEQAEADYDWCLSQPPEVLRPYAGQVIVVHQRTILGSGVDHREALENARQQVAAHGRPFPEVGLVFVVVPQPVHFDPKLFAITPDRPTES